MNHLSGANCSDRKYNKPVEILGAKYKIKEKTVEKDNRLEDCYGFVDWTSKEIILEKKLTGTLHDVEKFKEKVLRHEIIHAFFMESGLLKYSNDEELVDWIAFQFPKLYKVMKTLGIEE